MWEASVNEIFDFINTRFFYFASELLLYNFFIKLIEINSNIPIFIIFHGLKLLIFSAVFANTGAISKLKNLKWYRKIYVYIAERTPWSNLPKIYGFADIFSFEITLSTCSITDSPPKPKRKLHIIILTDIALFGIRLICFIPFVSSIIPVIIPWYVGRIYIKIFKEWFE